jgi:hypothetical protein
MSVLVSDDEHAPPPPAWVLFVAYLASKLTALVMLAVYYALRGDR